MKHIINTSKKPSLPFNGATIELHEDMGEIDWSKQSPVLHLEPEQTTGVLAGSELSKRMRGKSYNATVLDYLMEHQDQIPEVWKEKTKDCYTQVIYFWGTIFRSAGGNLCVRLLYWHDGRWRFYYRWLDDGCGGGNPAACPASSSSPVPKPSQTLDPLTLIGKVYKDSEGKLVIKLD